MSDNRVKIADLISKAPTGATALIVAIEKENGSDLLTDYHASTRMRVVAIAWRTTKVESFKALRKAAGRFPATAHLKDAPKSAEHRENWSMGAGNYLKAGGRHESGWEVRSFDLKFQSYQTDLVEDAIEFCSPISKGVIW